MTRPSMSKEAALKLPWPDPSLKLEAYKTTFCCSDDCIVHGDSSLFNGLSSCYYFRETNERSKNLTILRCFTLLQTRKRSLAGMNMSICITHWISENSPAREKVAMRDTALIITTPLRRGYTQNLGWIYTLI